MLVVGGGMNSVSILLSYSSSKSFFAVENNAQRSLIVSHMFFTRMKKVILCQEILNNVDLLASVFSILESVLTLCGAIMLFNTENTQLYFSYHLPYCHSSTSNPRGSSKQWISPTTKIILDVHDVFPLIPYRYGVFRFQEGF